MSWSNAFSGNLGTRFRSGRATRLARPLVLATLMLAWVSVLSACNFQPVYSGAMASNPLLQLAYAKPESRLEQIIYQELALRFGTSAASTAPLASVTVSSGVGGIASMTANTGVGTPYRVTVNATLSITRRDGNVDDKPIVISRTASADFTTTGQVLADTAADNEARERAAKAVAESLRLGILATLSR